MAITDNSTSVDRERVRGVRLNDKDSALIANALHRDADETERLCDAAASDLAPTMVAALRRDVARLREIADAVENTVVIVEYRS